MSILKTKILKTDNSEKETSGKTIMERKPLSNDTSEKQHLTNDNSEKEKEKLKMINLRRTDLKKNKADKENTAKEHI